MDHKFGQNGGTWLLGAALVSLLMLAAPLPAAADSIYGISSTTVVCTHGSCPTGLSFAPGSTITIDTGTGLTTASSLSVQGLSDTFTSLPNVLDIAVVVGWRGSLGDLIELNPYTGGVVQFCDSSCSAWIATGQVALTPTPEPSSLLLFGGSLAALLGMRSRRVAPSIR